MPSHDGDGVPEEKPAPVRKARNGKLQKRDLVQVAAAKMRDMILAQAPDVQIGSLRELALALGVGIVTVQQAARILEHEGLLKVRRGPGGGYYGARHRAETLERLRAVGPHRT